MRRSWRSLSVSPVLTTAVALMSKAWWAARAGGVPKLRPGCVLAPGLKALAEPRPRGPGSIVMRV